jgi:predicted GH43/DUF377 family glycosyl hydrolase
MSRRDQPPASPGTAGIEQTRFRLQRLGVVMESEAGNSFEAEGVLNPAVARGPDGELYLFPRLVSQGNYSRIGVARVRFNGDGDPVAAERLGIALEPTAGYELRADGGGCEDPRITFVEPLERYVMTYTAYSSDGPRIALAISEDLFHWERLGLATFEPYQGLNFNGVNNKDALVFPVAVPDPDGRPAMAMIHRPLFPGTEAAEIAAEPTTRTIDLDRESIWISYCPLELDEMSPGHLCHFRSHHRLASPTAPWEQVKIGGGAPPVRTPDGWLMIYHGVGPSDLRTGADGGGRNLRYSAGALVLDQRDPRIIRYRSSTPILIPELQLEREGAVAEVVFPTGVDRRSDLGHPSRIDVYYGMADSRIGAARLDVPAPTASGTA